MRERETVVSWQRLEQDPSDLSLSPALVRCCTQIKIRIHSSMLQRTQMHYSQGVNKVATASESMCIIKRMIWNICKSVGWIVVQRQTDGTTYTCTPHTPHH